MPLFRNAAYSLSVAGLDDPLPESAGEIAFAGRSNSGKSSALNALAGRKRLAFVSKTPGRTRMINFYALGAGRYLVDLPGYGYASTPKAVRAQWDRLLGAYLSRRAALRGLVLVMDIRRPLTASDMELIEFFRSTGKPIHALLAKADKLSRAKAFAVLRAVQTRLASLSPKYSAQLFSSRNGSGVQEAETALCAWFPSAPGVRAVRSPGQRSTMRNRTIGSRGRGSQNKKTPD